MNTIAAEELIFFVAFELSKEKVLHRWDPDLTVVEHTGTQPRHALTLKKAIIGKNAKPGELNLIEMRTKNSMGKEVSVPLSFLRHGTDFQCELNITIPDEVVEFHLVEGEGPIHILGQHVVRARQFDDNDEQEEPEAGYPGEDVYSESHHDVEESSVPQNELMETDTKRKLESNQNGGVKKSKFDEDFDKEDGEPMNVDVENTEN